MIDLDDIRARGKITRDGFYHVVGAYYVVREADFDALVAEVERLREIVALDGAHERTMTVAFLRDFAQYTNTAETEDAVLRAAELIERGEHRTEEKIP